MELCPKSRPRHRCRQRDARDRERRLGDRARRARPTAPAEPRKVERLAKRFAVKDVNLYYGDFQAVQDVTMTIEPNKVTALIGSSGCGKTTFLRSLNRMHELTPGARVEGEVTLDDQDIYASAIDPVEVRRLVGHGLPGAQPVPDDVGLRERRRRAQPESKGSRSPRRTRWSRGPCAAPTSGTRSRTGSTSPAPGLSGGQQQRLCIARATAVEPEVLLMDEPCSALDPVATLAVEDLIAELKTSYTIVIVTHNMQQAARASDITAFFNLEAQREARPPGRDGRHREDVHQPSKKETEDYVSGRFG